PTRSPSTAVRPEAARGAVVCACGIAAARKTAAKTNRDCMLKSYQVGTVNLSHRNVRAHPLQQQSHRELGAAARALAVSRDRAAMPLHKLADNRQAQSEAAL